MADATVDSWKDEFALVVLLAPAILVFIPGMRVRQRGVSSSCYSYLIGISIYIAISASFGIKVGRQQKC